MRKIIPILGILLLTVSVSAQNFLITDDNTGNNVTGKKVLLTVNDSAPNAINFTITSPTNSGKAVKVKRILIMPLAGTTNAFCWARQCYPDDVDVSPDVVDFTQVSSAVFTADFNPMGDGVKHTGTFAVRYVFFDEMNAKDSSFFDLQFDVRKNAAIKTIAKAGATVSAVYPNPSTVKAGLKYQFNNTNTTVAKVYNLLGTEVLSQAITAKQGILELSVSDLQNGLYFITLIADNKPLTTRKFTVSH